MSVPKIPYFIFLAVVFFGSNLNAQNNSPSFLEVKRPKGFCVRLKNGMMIPYRLNDNTHFISDQNLEAKLRKIAGDRWELEIKAKKLLTEIYFPWEFEETALNGSIHDDIVYFPHQLGVVEKASTLVASEWKGELYPGRCFAPLVVVADKYTARMVAAANWPPRYTKPIYSLGRTAINYTTPLPIGSKETYCSIVVEANGEPREGNYPWHHVLDSYKEWLLAMMRPSSLYPIAYPLQMIEANGWLHISLHKISKFDIKELSDIYSQWKDLFPWIQFWGQMSNYHRSPRDGLTEYPHPPLKVAERTGCCVDIPKFHSRYLPDLPLFSKKVVSSGGTVGYYSRPKSPYRELDKQYNNEDLFFFYNWVEENRENGANAFYLDVLGARSFGQPLNIARLLQEKFPKMSVIERAVDVYPAAFLVSGCLWGNHQWATKPGQTPEDLSDTINRLTFPRFGRYLLDDRIIFLGFSNGDFMWWGNYRGYEHWTERQAFLLGAKLDVPTKFKGRRGWIEAVNPIVKMIVNEWERVGWWKRAPMYRDYNGIYGATSDIDVRRFVDKDGINLFVVDNWHERENSFFYFEGRKISVSQKKLSIVVMQSSEK